MAMVYSEFSAPSASTFRKADSASAFLGHQHGIVVIHCNPIPSPEVSPTNIVFIFGGFPVSLLGGQVALIAALFPITFRVSPAACPAMSATPIVRSGLDAKGGNSLLLAALGTLLGRIIVSHVRVPLKNSVVVRGGG
jgi:hypothetical protein